MLRTRLKSFARGMVVGIQRAARSPLKNQAYDFGVAIMDASGSLLEEDEFRALFPFAIHPGCRDVVSKFPDDVAPGDVFIHNDVFGGNLQLNDAGFYVPIFVGTELVGLTGAKGHLADLGGPVPSSCNPEASDYFAEGLRIPATKVFDRGVFRRDVWNLIFSNFRLPEIDGPDMMGLVAVCRQAAERISETVEHLGIPRFNATVEALYDMTENLVRGEISGIPDGTYHGSSSFYADGPEQHVGDINLTVTVAGDELTMDYSGTSPQAPTYCNAPLGSTMAGIMTYLSMILDPRLPHNEGMYRPLHFVIPEGSLLNPRPPAATYYGNFMSAMNSEAIMKAFSAAVPERVTAGWTRPMSLQITAYDPRRQRRYGDIDFIALKGGSGAGDGIDGWNNGPIFGVSTLTNDYEFFEVQDPHVLLQHEFKVDSAGAGRWRGGHGAITRWRFEGESATLVLQGDRDGGFGMFGADAGTDNEFVLHFPDGSHHRPYAKEIIRVPVPAGTIVERHSGGGGGFGDPHERDPEAVLTDVRAGVVSRDAARQRYGVVLDDDASSVDRDATASLRAESDRGGRA
jgi:N-methylhydantoinase B